MAAPDLSKYLDERGAAVLAHEDRLRELGLNVLKEKVGNLVPPAYGGIIALFDLAFERRDEKFSAELVEFLKNEIKLTPDAIAQLEQQAVYRGQKKPPVPDSQR